MQRRTDSPVQSGGTEGQFARVRQIWRGKQTRAVVGLPVVQGQQVWGFCGYLLLQKDFLAIAGRV